MLVWRQVYGAVTMNNTMCLGLFLLVVHARGLNWDFTSEVIVTVGAFPPDSRCTCPAVMTHALPCHLAIALSKVSHVTVWASAYCLQWPSVSLTQCKMACRHDAHHGLGVLQSPHIPNMVRHNASLLQLVAFERAVFVAAGDIR